MGLFDQYIPPDVPSGAVDPQELERAKYLAMIRAGLGVANREPLQNAFGGGLKAYIGAQANARQQMLAQLQAYKDRQEIGAKAKAMQQNEALQGDLKNVFGSAPITASGGPTEANAMTALIGQYERASVRLAQENKFEDAKRASDIAIGLKKKYFPTPHMVKGPNGELRMVQLSESGDPKMLDVLPFEKQQHIDTGGAYQFRGEYTNALGETVPKTPSPSDRNTAARLAFDKTQAGKPVWDSTSGQFVTPPTEAAPSGSAVVPTGFVAKPKTAPEEYSKQIGGIVNVNTAIGNYLDKLKGWSNIDMANTTKRAAIGTAYNNTMLQLKEAYRLGVLNGPDYDILTTVLTDPLTVKGAITSNAAIEAQSKQVRTVLRENAHNLAKVYKQPSADIDALLPEVDETAPAADVPLSATEEAELARLRAKHPRRP